MWEKAGSFIPVIVVLVAGIGAYYDLQYRVSNLEDAKLVKWKASIEKYQSSGKNQCADMKVDFDMSHGFNQKEWCPENYFITKIDLDAHNKAEHGPVDDDRNSEWTFPIIGRVT